MDFIRSVIDWILSNWMTGWMGLFLYWVPLSICVVGYTLRTAENYQKDLLERDKYRNLIKNRKELEDDQDALDSFNRRVRECHDSDKYTAYYNPTDKIGTLIGRALVSIVPVANLWAGMFDVAPRLFHRLIERIEVIFDTPLVPEPKDV